MYLGLVAGIYLLLGSIDVTSTVADVAQFSREISLESLQSFTVPANNERRHIPKYTLTNLSTQTCSVTVLYAEDHTGLRFKPVIGKREQGPRARGRRRAKPNRIKVT